MKQKQHHNPSRLLRLFTTEKIEITDPIVLATHTTEGTGSSTQHFCLINNQKTEVKTTAQLNNNRLYFQGSEITDPIVLATHTTEGTGSSTQHFCLINNQKTEVKTTAQRNNNRLYFQGSEITDPIVLATHTTEGRGSSTQHFCLINNQKTEVKTAAQRNNNRLYFQGSKITDPTVLATHTTEGRGSSTQHFCLINNQQTEVNTARQRYNRKEAPSNTPLKKRPKISCESEVHEGIYTGVIKQEPSAFLPWLSLPPLTVKELQEVAHILRGNSVADDNCAKYAMAFMEYFSTRILPH